MVTQPMVGTGTTKIGWKSSGQRKKRGTWKNKLFNVRKKEKFVSADKSVGRLYWAT
jgi:hypothetical protein